jgi:sulfate transport system ATP-binding protein
MEVTVQEISKAFGHTAAVHELSLEIAAGELLALLGPSGSGKTTLLRLIAGIEFADSGRVLFGGQDTSRLPIQERQIGFVFQNYALFRHMRVIDNIAFGLSVRKRAHRPSKAEIRARALDLLDLVQLSGLDQRFPHELSGGQRQRVALARALAIEPRVLLLDEPFGALDAQVRKELRAWLKELHRKTGHTTLFVTHDQQEALELADRVVVMNAGRIEQVGTPSEIYDTPATPFVFSFVGQANRIILPVVNDRVTLPGGECVEMAGTGHGEAELFFRPHDVSLARRGQSSLSGRVLTKKRSGLVSAVLVETPVGLIEAEFPSDEPLEAGQEIHLSVMRGTLFSGGGFVRWQTER